MSVLKYLKRGSLLWSCAPLGGFGTLMGRLVGNVEVRRSVGARGAVVLVGVEARRIDTF